MGDRVLYRATEDPAARPGAHFARDLDDAIEYTENQGFGGPQVYRYKVGVLPGTHLDAEGAGGRIEVADAWLARASDREIADIADSAGLPEGAAVRPEDVVMIWNSDGYQLVFHVLENEPNAEKALVAEGYRWISFTDDYPQGAITWKYLQGPPIAPVELVYDSEEEDG